MRYVNFESLTPEMQVFVSRLTTRRLYVIGGIGILLLISAALGILALVKGTEANETFRFIALLIIFMAALATSAAVFVGLRMGNSGEAFGLPSGSVRALLAIGIMILFVVFGLPLISPDPGRSVAALTVTVPRAEIDQAIELHREQGLNVRVVDYGRDATTDPATGAAVAGAPARIQIFGNAASRSEAELDIGKQLVTAIITLLTTVIGFYFGSRSTAEGMKEAGTQAASSAATDLNVQRKQLEDKFANLKTEILAKGQLIDSGKDGPVPTDSGEAAERQAALDRAVATRLTVEGRRDEIAKHLSAAGEALTALAEATQADVRSVHERDARDNLQRAAELLAALEEALSGYASEVDAFVQANAAG